MNDKLKKDLNQLLKDLHVELKEWEAQKKPSKLTKKLISERHRFISAIQVIMLTNIPTKLPPNPENLQAH